ncbi:MAG: DUF4252 domain-containing protein [Tannerellaceae bacterium]|jgi:hypothetical protein|nr:DUF4252 domain-containing protein [Tannerellaceae bacterium]
MKKSNKFWILALLAALCLTVEGQSIDRLFKEFASADNNESVKLGRFMLTLAGAFTDTYGVNGVEVISLEKADEAVKQRFAEAVGKVRDSGYELMIDARENKQRTRVMARMKADIIQELVVLSFGDNPALIRIKGSIKKSDIDRILQEHKK